MIESDMQVVLAMLLYFVVVVVIGFVYAKRSNSSSEEYFLGGRGLGPWLTALSAEASDMSGWLLMGLPGVAYFTGASDAMWTAIGLAIGTYLNWKFVAKRLRKYSEKAGNAITVPDFFSNRFHDTKHILMTIAAVIILLFFTIYSVVYRTLSGCIPLCPQFVGTYHDGMCTCRKCHSVLYSCLIPCSCIGIRCIFTVISIIASQVTPGIVVCLLLICNRIYHGFDTCCLQILECL